MNISHEQRLRRLHEAIAAHLACAGRIDHVDDIAQAVLIANGTGDAMEDASFALPQDLRSMVLEARRKMDESLQRLNARSRRAGIITMIEQQCSWSRTVLARVPELMG